MPPPEEQMQQQQAATSQIQPQEAQTQQAYQATDSSRCQYVFALPTEMAAEKFAGKILQFFDGHKVGEGLGPNQFELHRRETTDGKSALVVRVPSDRSTLKEFMVFLKDEGIKLLKAAVKEIKKLFEKEPGPFLKEAAEKTESLFGGGPGHGLGKGN